MNIPTGYVPVEPLEALARAEYARREAAPQEWSNNLFASLVGVSNRAIGRWRQAGGIIPWITADVAAIRLGFHPSIVWPMEWAELDRGIIDGTDARGLRQVDAAIEQIGRILDQRKVVA